MVGGNGLVMWAIKEIPSGVAALVIATIPLWMTLFEWMFYRGPRPTLRVICGLAMGITGIVFLLKPDQLLAGTEGLHWPSMGALFLAPIFWSIGSLQSRHVELPPNIFMTTAAESICGGIVLLLLSIGLGETTRMNLGQISARSVLATIYLAIFCSLFTLTAYSWLLKNVSVARVSTYMFVNPVIAVFLGWMVLSEEVSWETIVAVVLVVSAVVLIVMRKQSGQRRQTSRREGSAKISPTSSFPDEKATLLVRSQTE
jgi:drug/metabolite transporter (DMT)-like permease